MQKMYLRFSEILLYGFGELIDQSMKTNDLLKQSMMQQYAQNPNPDQNQGPMPGSYYPGAMPPMAPNVVPPMNQGNYANMAQNMPPQPQPWNPNQN